MAETPVSDEEMALRRRSRRRLVGAVALALVAVVVLPMVFEREPKPLGPDVDVQIPGKDTAFEPANGKAVAPLPAPVAAPIAVPTSAAAVTPASPEPAPSAAKPVLPEKVTEPVAHPVEHKAAKPAVKPAASSAKDEGLYLQLGVFDKQENAEKLVAHAKTAGFKAQITEAAGKTRVRIGPLADRAKAETYIAQLKAKGLSAVLVAP